MYVNTASVLAQTVAVLCSGKRERRERRMHGEIGASAHSAGEHTAVGTIMEWKRGRGGRGTKKKKYP